MNILEGKGKCHKVWMVLNTCRSKNQGLYHPTNNYMISSVSSIPNHSQVETKMISPTMVRSTAFSLFIVYYILIISLVNNLLSNSDDHFAKRCSVI